MAVNRLLALISIYLITETTTVERRQYCPYLYIPNNGKLVTISSSKVQFSCNEHYVLYGSDELICKDGKWSDRQPICRLKQNSCGDPGTPENGYRLGRVLTIGQSVRYRCKSNFVLVGPDRIKCLDNQQWSDKLPSCHAADNISAIAHSIRNNLIDKYDDLTESSHSRSKFEKSSNVTAVGIDLVILLDQSSSIDPVDFKKTIEFVKSLIEEFGVSSPNSTGGTRVAIVTFGDSAQVELNLNDPEIVSLEALADKLDQIPASGGATNMEAGFLNIVSHILPVVRPNSKKIILITSDGQSNRGGPPENVADILKMKHGFEIFAIAIGNEVDKSQLILISSPPYYSHVYQLKNFRHLEELTDYLTQTSYKVPEHYKCGVSNGVNLTKEGTNVNGAEVVPGSWPWIVAIHVENIQNGRGVTFYCGGALICNQWLITGAHCLRWLNTTFNPNQISVTLGEHDLIKWENKEKNFQVETVISHPAYQSTSFDNDIALIKLKDAAKFSKNIRPVCLPKKEHADLTKIIDTTTWVVGWGSTQIRDVWVDVTPRSVVPYQFAMNITNPQLCKKYLKKTFRYKLKMNNIFCAGKSFGASPSCTGDSGGSLVIKESNRFTLAGIVSWGDDCVQFEKYSIFTRVINYIDWIANITNNCFSKHF